MSAAGFVDLASMIALVILGVALLLSIVRIIIGPTLADRVLALDLMTVVAMGFIPEQRTPLALGVASLCILLIAYWVRHFLRRGVLPEVRLDELAPPKLRKN